MCGEGGGWEAVGGVLSAMSYIGKWGDCIC